MASLVVWLILWTACAPAPTPQVEDSDPTAPEPDTSESMEESVDTGPVCDHPFAACDGADTCSVDLRTTAAHCGTCGHDCLGGQCFEEHCTAWSIDSELIRIDGPRYDGDRILFHSSDYVTLNQLDPTTAQITELATADAAELVGAREIVVVDVDEEDGVVVANAILGGILWGPGQQDAFFVWPQGGDRASALVLERDDPSGAVLHQGRLYWIDGSWLRDEPRILWSIDARSPGPPRAEHDFGPDGGPDRIGNEPIGIWRDRLLIHYMGDGVAALPLSGGAQPEILHPDTRGCCVSVAALLGDTLYLEDNYDGDMIVVDLSTGASDRISIYEDSYSGWSGAVAYGEGALYFPRDGFIWAQPIDSTQPATIVQEQPFDVDRMFFGAGRLLLVERGTVHDTLWGLVP